MIIAHRGARGLELENSLASLQAALAFDVDAIEFDVHLTKDGQLVVMHDATTRRTATDNVRISDVTLDELRKLRLKNNQQIPTLDEALGLMENRHVFIDIKGKGCADPLVELIKNHPLVTASYESYRPSELARIRELLPDAMTYPYFLKAHYLIARPYKMVRIAKEIDATGISIDKLYLLNPLTYYLARRNKFETLVYSVGSKGLTRMFRRCYPALNVITSRPDAINHQSFPSD